jgi:hypothetical protein
MSGDIDIDIDVKRWERVQPALRRGLKEGLADAGNYLIDHGEDKAKDAVLSADRVWRRTLKEGFENEENDFSRTTHWQGHIRNLAPHAQSN